MTIVSAGVVAIADLFTRDAGRFFWPYSVGWTVIACVAAAVPISLFIAHLTIAEFDRKERWRRWPRR